MAQDRSHGRFRCYEGARVNVIGTVGSIDTGRPVACRLDQELPRHFGTSQFGR
jgi:hypothetical protein